METIKEFCNRLKISRAIYYKLAHRLKKRPTEQDIEKHKETARTGRPRKDNF